MIDGPNKKAFLCCKICNLVFSETRFVPSLKEQKKRYIQPNNGVQYTVYLNSLNLVIEQTTPLLSKEMTGLDFDCGPTPVIGTLLEKQGINCINYDPIYFNEIPEGQYDFIFANECFEHFFFPAKEIRKIKDLLKPNGYLIVITEKWNSSTVFTKWPFAKDSMHVSFYHSDSFQYIAAKYGFTACPSKNQKVFIFQKQKIEELSEITEVAVEIIDQVV